MLPLMCEFTASVPTAAGAGQDQSWELSPGSPWVGPDSMDLSPTCDGAMAVLIEVQSKK